MAFVLSASAGAFAGEKLPLERAPMAVQDAVKKTLGTATLIKLTKEVEEGKTLFEAEFKVGQAEHSATFSEGGKVLEEEQEVKVADVPATVTAAIAKAAPTGKVQAMSLVKADGKTFFEAKVAIGEETHEIKVAQDGSVMSNEVEKEDEDEDDKGKEGKK